MSETPTACGQFVTEFKPNDIIIYEYNGVECWAIVDHVNGAGQLFIAASYQVHWTHYVRDFHGPAMMVEDMRDVRLAKAGVADAIWASYCASQLRCKT